MLGLLVLVVKMQLQLVIKLVISGNLVIMLQWAIVLGIICSFSLLLLLDIKPDLRIKGTMLLQLVIMLVIRIKHRIPLLLEFRLGRITKVQVQQVNGLVRLHLVINLV